MPFITDDYESKLVDDDEYYGNLEYKNWVIARTLCVWRHKRPFPDVDYLERRFRKYGKIESTKVLESKNQGYVTFSCDRHACLAFDHEEEESDVGVAYTWQQPSIVTTSNWRDEDRVDGSIVGGQYSPFLQLNDDCLYGIFGLCTNESLANLAETCKRFRELLTSTYKFPNRELKLETFESNYCTKMSMSLTTVRKIVRLMGPYFQKFDFHLRDVDKDVVLRYLETVLQYCKTNKRIHTLKLLSDFWLDEFDCLIRATSTNLENLNVFIVECDSFPDSIAEIYMCPKLKNLIINNNKYGPTLRAKNPQISLKFTARDDKDFPTLLARLPNIQKFTWLVDESFSLDIFLPLSQFGQLKKVKLVFGEYCDTTNLRELLETFNGLDSLKELKLYFGKAPRKIKLLAVLARVVPDLERLDLLGVRGITKSEVVNFVRDSKKLRSFHVHHSKFFATDSLITELVSVRKSLHQEKLNLYLDGSGPKTTVDIERYVNIQYNNCSHLSWYF
ncbi:hypothetical protein HA402_001369 [Bradysia odoriphaga]|nr:hypothetical protein HA402_001369 [Bradysia odoriphaga]